MKFSSLKFAVMALGLSSIASATVSTISFGNLGVGVNNASAVNGSTGGGGGLNNQASGNGVNAGGLASLSFAGVQIYDVANAIRDNGFMIGAGLANFGSFNSNYIGSPAAVNSTITGFTVSGSGSSQQVVVSGTYTGAGSSTVGTWTRTYSFVSGDILREVVSFTNTSGASLSNLRIWGAFDPDNGTVGAPNGFTTQNSTGTLSGFNYARSLLPNGSGGFNINAILASNTAGVNISFLPNSFGATPMTVPCLDSLLGIGGGTCTVGASGTSDQTYAYAINFATIANGGSASATVYHIFGTGGSAFDLASAFATITGSSTSSSTSTTSTSTSTSTSSSSGDVPEPGTMSLLGGAFVILGIVARRRK